MSRKCSLQVTRKLIYRSSYHFADIGKMVYFFPAKALRFSVYLVLMFAVLKLCDCAVIFPHFAPCFQLISCAISCAQHSFLCVFLLVCVILHHAPYHHALSITARQKPHNRNNPITATKSPSLTKSDGRGADSGNRTHDLFITSEPLYRLSHISIQGARCLIPA